jgi:hypothetical protein
MQEESLKRAEILLLNVRNTEIILLTGAHHPKSIQLSAKPSPTHPVHARFCFPGS